MDPNLTSTTCAVPRADGSTYPVPMDVLKTLQSTQPPTVCEYRQALTFIGIQVQRVESGASFQLKRWSGEGASYSLSVITGKVQSTGNSGKIY